MIKKLKTNGENIGKKVKKILENRINIDEPTPREISEYLEKLNNENLNEKEKYEIIKRAKRISEKRLEITPYPLYLKSEEKMDPNYKSAIELIRNQQTTDEEIILGCATYIIENTNKKWYNILKAR